MKFLLTMHMNPPVWNAFTDDERAAIGNGHGAFMDTITKSGEMITTQALADPSQSVVVRVWRTARRHRRSVPRVQGIPRRLLPDRLREQGTGDRARGDDPRRRGRGHGHRGAPGDVLRRTARGVRADSDATTEDLLRELAPQVLGVLVRRYGQFELCEDAVQEACSRRRSPGRPTGSHIPRGWLMTAASRRLIDLIRASHARRAREVSAAAAEPELDSRSRRRRTGRGRHVDPVVPVLPPGAHPRVADRADTARGRRAQHRRDRARVPRPRRHDGCTDQPGQAEHPRRRAASSPCRAPASARNGCAWSSTRCTSSSTRATPRRRE